MNLNRIAGLSIFLLLALFLSFNISAQSVTITQDSISLDQGTISGYYTLDSFSENTTISTSLNLKGNSIYNLSDPQGPSYVVDKDYVDQEALKSLSEVLEEGNEADRDIIFDGAHTVSGLPSPDGPTDAATKEFVEATISEEGEASNLSNVLTAGNDADGRIIDNLGAPNNSDDAVTVAYLEQETEADDQSLSGVLVYGATANQSIDMDGHRIQNVVASAEGDAVNKSYVDDLVNQTSSDDQTLTVYNNTDGTVDEISIENGNRIAIKDDFEANTDNQTLSDVLDEGDGAGGQRIVNLQGPENPNDAATKNYVDTEVALAGSDNQTLSTTANVSGTDDNISISSGNYIIVDDAFAADDQDLQATTRSGQTVTIPIDDGASTSFTDRNGTDDQNLAEVLGQNNDAGSTAIVNLANSTQSQAAVTYSQLQDYVDSNTQDGDSSSTNELQSLSEVLVYGAVANQSIDIDNHQLQNVVADDPGDAVNKSYVDGQISQAGSDNQELTVYNNTNGVNDAVSIENGNNVTIKDDYEANTDNQTLSEVLGEDNDAGSVAIVGLDNSTSAQAAVTYSQLQDYVSSNNADGDASPTNEIQNLTEVLGQGNNADGKVIINYGDPSDSDTNTVADVGYVQDYVSSSSNADADADPSNELQNISVDSSSTNDVIELNSGDDSTTYDTATIDDDVNPIETDLVAGDGLSGTSNNVLPGNGGEVSLSLASSVAGTQLNYSSGVLSVYQGAGSGLNADTLDGVQLADITWTDVDMDQSDVTASDVTLGNVRNVDLANTAGSFLSYDTGNEEFNVDADGDLVMNSFNVANMSNATEPQEATTLSQVNSIVSGADKADADADTTNELQSLSVDSSGTDDVITVDGGDDSSDYSSVTLDDEYVGNSGTHMAGGELDMNGNDIIDSSRGNVSFGDDIKVHGNMYTNGADLAERYRSSQDLEAGEIVTVSGEEDNTAVRSDEEYDGEVLGVVSTQPGQVINAKIDGEPIALTGKVPVKVSDVNGDIERGDRIVPSGTPGVGMKCELIDPVESEKDLRSVMSHNQDCRSSTIGKALEPSSGGKVLVAVE